MTIMDNYVKLAEAYAASLPMTKFHVGDRWADQNGDKWLVTLVEDDGFYAACMHSPTLWMFDTDGFNECNQITLTRLISSERWIPFAEMMPGDAYQEKRTIIIRNPTREADDARERLVVPVSDQCGHWEWLESHQDDGIEDMIGHGYVEWKYLTPPEAP